MVPNARAVGEAKRILRRACGKSLRSVAKLMKVSPAYLSDMERGSRLFSPEQIANFEKALKS